MAWWIEVRELADDAGKGIGKFRKTAWSDEDGGGPYGLCKCEHLTREEAHECPIARKEAARY